MDRLVARIGLEVGAECLSPLPNCFGLEAGRSLARNSFRPEAMVEETGLDSHIGLEVA